MNSEIKADMILEVERQIRIFKDRFKRKPNKRIQQEINRLEKIKERLCKN